jgi:hypothetical protein
MNAAAAKELKRSFVTGLQHGNNAERMTHLGASNGRKHDK